MGQGQSAKAQTHTLKGNHFDVESLQNPLKLKLECKSEKNCPHLGSIPSLVLNKHQEVNGGFQSLQQNRVIMIHETQSIATIWAVQIS